MDITDPLPQPDTPEPVFLLLCAWCGRSLGNAQSGAKGHSYGICSECAALYFPDRDSDPPEPPVEPVALLFSLGVLARVGLITLAVPDSFRRR